MYPKDLIGYCMYSIYCINVSVFAPVTLGYLTDAFYIATFHMPARKTGNLSFDCNFNAHWHTSLVACSCVCVLKPERDACQNHLLLISTHCWVQRSAWGSKFMCDQSVRTRFLDVVMG